MDDSDSKTLLSEEVSVQAAGGPGFSDQTLTSISVMYREKQTRDCFLNLK